MNGLTLKISDFLTEKQVLFFSADVPKQPIFEDLVHSLELPDAAQALKAILNREQWGSTEITPGLELPHARIPGIKRVAPAMGICPSKIFVLFLGPTDHAEENLAFLASVSTLFQTQDLLKRLMNLKTPRAVLAEIRDAEKRL